MEVVMKTFRCQVIDKAESFGMSRDDAIAFYESILDIMRDILKTKESLTIRGFGTLRVKEIKSRIVKSTIINNGEPTRTKTQKNVKFKIADKLKAFLNS